MSKAEKKAYRKPVLRTYGNVHQITKTKVSGSKSDGGSMGMGKTGVSSDDDD